MKKQLAPQNEMTIILINKLVKAKVKLNYYLGLYADKQNECNDILKQNTELYTKNISLQESIKALQNQETIQRNAYKESLQKHQDREANVDKTIDYDIPQLLQSEYFLVVTNGNHKGELFEGQIYKLLKKGGGARVGHFSNEWNKNFFTKPTIIKK